VKEFVINVPDRNSSVGSDLSIEGEETAAAEISFSSGEGSTGRQPSALKYIPQRSQGLVQPSTESYVKRRLSVMEDLQRGKFGSKTTQQLVQMGETSSIEHPELARAERVMLRGMKAAQKEREVAVKERAMITLILVREGDVKLKRRFFRIWLKGAHMQKHSTFLESHMQQWQRSCSCGKGSYCLGYKRFDTNRFVLPSVPALLAATSQTRRHHHHHNQRHHHHGVDHAAYSRQRTQQIALQQMRGTHEVKPSTTGWQHSLASLPVLPQESLQTSLSSSFPTITGLNGSPSAPSIRRDRAPELIDLPQLHDRRALQQPGGQHRLRFQEVEKKKGADAGGKHLAAPQEVVHFFSGQRVYLDVNTMQILSDAPPHFVPYATGFSHSSSMT